MCTFFPLSRYFTRNHGNQARPLGTLFLQTTSLLLGPNMPTMLIVRLVWDFLSIVVTMAFFVRLLLPNRSHVCVLQLKYKLEHEKQKGHYLAGTQINDFQSVVHSLAFQKMRSAVSFLFLPLSRAQNNNCNRITV